jgi:membrane protease subunit HflK
VKVPWSGLPAWQTLLFAAALTAIIGFYAFTFRVNPDELGVVLRFGKPSRQEPPGLHYRMPYPIDEVHLPKITRWNIIEVGIRTPSEGGRATRVREESSMLTGDENIIDVSFVVLWRIQDPGKYLFNIQNPETTVKDLAESALRDCRSIREPTAPDECAAADRRSRAKAHAGNARPLRGRHSRRTGTLTKH